MRVKAHELWGCKRSETEVLIQEVLAKREQGPRFLRENVTFTRLRPPTEWCKSRSALAYLRLHYLCTYYGTTKKEERNRNTVLLRIHWSYIQKIVRVLKNHKDVVNIWLSHLGYFFPLGYYFFPSSSLISIYSFILRS